MKIHESDSIYFSDLIIIRIAAKYPLLLWGAFIIAAPIFEEFFFRGFLLKGLSSSFLKPAGTVVVTSLLWAVIHLQYDLFEIIIIFLLGIFLGISRLKTGSSLLTTGIHSLWNLVAMTETYIHMNYWR